MKEKVIVGLSGGVDSAVSAHLLKEKGYEVIGVFMKNWEETDEKTGICAWKEDYKDAQKIAKHLDIELRLVSFEKEYFENVFLNYFIKEHQKFRTPNPDILCNKEIKFNAFLDYVYKNFKDVKHIATGHYARIIKNNNDFFLAKAKDSKKDQTYFLSQLSKNQLQNVLFPIGDLEKSKVREIAKNNNIPVFNKKDSTGICFIGPGNYQNFIKRYLKKEPGKIINIENNEEKGTHIGLSFYTIGQSKGLNIGGDPKYKNKGKWFVVKKDAKKNILYVANGKENKYYLSNKLIAKNLNFFDTPKYDNFKCRAKFRYRQKDIDVKVKLKDKKAIVEYNKDFGVTPGQAVVFYSNDICLGSGFIDEVYQNTKRIDK